MDAFAIRRFYLKGFVSRVLHSEGVGFRVASGFVGSSKSLGDMLAVGTAVAFDHDFNDAQMVYNSRECLRSEYTKIYDP